MSSTTLAGKEFIREPLKNCMGNTQIALPGISKSNSKKLKEYGIVNETQLFGQYLAFNMNDEIFLSYLKDEVGIVFVGNNYGTVEDYQQKLCSTLKEKWEIIKNY